VAPRKSKRTPRRPAKRKATRAAKAAPKPPRAGEGPLDAMPGGRKFWHQLFEHSPDSVFVVDRRHRIAYVNHGLAGRDGRRMLGADLCASLPTEHCGGVVEALDRVFRTGAPGGFEVPIPDRRNPTLVYEARLVPIRRAGRVAWVLITAVDVTEARRGARIQAATRLISEAAHTTPSLQALYGAIHGIVSELMTARNFYLALFDGELISFPYLVDEYDEAPAPKAPGRGLTEYVLRTGQPLLVTPEVMRELVERGEVELIGADSLDWLGVPLKTDDRTIGVLVVQSYTEGVRYSETDKHILQFVSTQVAMAIERKRGEAALRASEEQYRRLVEVAPELIAVHSEGRIVFMNPAGARLLGARDPAELLGRPVTDFVHPDSRPTVESRIQAMVRRGEHVPLIDEKFVRVDGSIVHVEVAATPLLYRDRPAIQVVVRDVSARVRAEAALRESEEKFRSFIESTTDWVWSIDPNGVHTYCNPAVVDILGYAPEELVGRSAFVFVHPDDREPVREQFALLAQERRGWRNLVIRWAHRDGSYRFLESSAVPIMGAGGALAGYRGVNRDISERVRAEEALRTSEVRLARAQAIAHLGIWELDLRDTADLDRNPLWWSDETYRIFGFEPGGVAVSNELFFRSVPPDDGARIHAAVAAALEGGEPYLVEHRIIRPDGQARVVREEASLVRDASGRPRRMMGTVLDVTEQRRLEAQLRQAQKMEAVGQLAGGIAHDFNNLLTTVLAANELLSAELPADQPHREDIETIRHAARRAADLTRSLLAFSRQQTLELRAVALDALLTDFVRLARRVLPEDVEVAAEVEAPDAVIRADAVAIEQVLMNLVTNARDAMPLGGKLRLVVARGTMDEAFVRTHGWGRPGAYVTLSVSDSGVGMDTETRRRVFEPFFTTKPVGEGTGLGLAMVYGLVKQHDGFVNVYSEPGQGTTIRLYFPVASEPAEPRPVPEPVELRGGSETIMLVEDDAFVRRTATRVLEKHGYTVVTANDGAEAIALLEEGAAAPDLVISDVVMPRASGPQLLEALRARGTPPRMLFTSGYTARDIHERGLLEADVPFLPKPWTIADLLRKVREALDRPPPAAGRA
jgi:two-component system cell cycle sensor histidine kinase/response regulator CckA